MIASLRGIISSKNPEGVVIDVGGIGYHVCIPLCSFSNVPNPGGEIYLHTYTHVREDALQLYGFLSEEERKVFVTLLGVTGIGPKLGLTILSGMPVHRFMEAVANEDISLLSTIPGLGRKTASRLVLELREKLPKASAASGNDFSGDAVSALVNLGYRRGLAEQAVNTAVKDGADTIEQAIKTALKSLTGAP